MMEEFTATGKPIPTLNRMPENNEEIEALMKAEGMTEFPEKVRFLQGALKAGRIHNITFSDVEKYKNIFLNYLKEEQGKQ